MKVKITGIKKIDKKLRQLEPKFAKKQMRKALRETQKKQMLPDVKNNAPTDEGDLKKALTVKSGKRSRYKMSMNVTFKDDALEDFYPRFVEYGAPEIGREPNPFMRRAFDAKKETVKSETEKRLLDLLMQEAKKK